jgi:hypothetical protein
MIVYTDTQKEGVEMAETEAQKRAREKYEKANTVQLHFKLNRNTDADILEKLDSVGNKQGYIKSLIRKDI